MILKNSWKNCDKGVVDYLQITKIFYIAKLIRDEGIDDDGISESKKLLYCLWELFLINSKKRLKTFVLAIDGFKVDKTF